MDHDEVKTRLLEKFDESVSKDVGDIDFAKVRAG